MNATVHHKDFQGASMQSLWGLQPTSENDIGRGKSGEVQTLRPMDGQKTGCAHAPNFSGIFQISPLCPVRVSRQPNSVAFADSVRPKDIGPKHPIDSAVARPSAFLAQYLRPEPPPPPHVQAARTKNQSKNISNANHRPRHHVSL